MLRSILVIALFFFGPEFVNAENAIRFMFESPIGSTCNDTDVLKLDNIFHPNRRKLRVAVGAQEQRELGSKSMSCACKGMAAYYCTSTFCNVRRQLTFKKDSAERELQTNLTCSVEINAMNDKLNKLISRKEVSASCMDLISVPNRKFSCINDVIFGEIDNIRLWKYDNAAAPVLLTNTMQDGAVTMCNNTLFTIEAKTNSCVDKIQFNLLGSNGFNYSTVEQSEPFYLWENNADVVNSRHLSGIGNYTLTMVPDYNYTKMKTVRFRIKAC